MEYDKPFKTYDELLNHLEEKYGLTIRLSEQYGVEVSRYLNPRNFKIPHNKRQMNKLKTTLSEAWDRNIGKENNPTKFYITNHNHVPA